MMVVTGEIVYTRFEIPSRVKSSLRNEMDGIDLLYQM